jgi:hypothetical protein
MDEAGKQPLADSQSSMSASNGSLIRFDYEDKRDEDANLFILSDLLMGRRYVQVSISHRSAQKKYLMLTLRNHPKSELALKFEVVQTSQYKAEDNCHKGWIEIRHLNDSASYQTEKFIRDSKKNHGGRLKSVREQGI